jgi:hypothetical protein
LKGVLDAGSEKPALEARSPEHRRRAARARHARPRVSGRLTLELAASGPLENLAFNGSVRME